MGTPLRALLVEDSQLDAELLVYALQRGGYDLYYQRVDTTVGLQAALQQAIWDIVISDYNLPGFSGLAALNIVREAGLNIPFLIVSGTIGEETAVEAMKAGAHDYIMKGNLARLLPAVERELREASERRHRQQAEYNLQNSEARLSAILNSAMDAIITVDANQHIRVFNTAAERMFGCLVIEAIGQRLDRFIQDSALFTLTDAEPAEHSLDVVGLPIGRQITGTGLRADGSTFPFEASISKVEIDTIQEKLYTAILRDVTERQQAEAQIRALNTELLQAYDTTLEGWSRALDLRDRETEGHTQRVTEKTLHLAQVIGFQDSDYIHLRRGALLHDIGKMAIPDSILLKPGPLTADEWLVMRQHPRLAYQLLSPINYLRPALEIPYSHHERWDGRGYPLGLQATPFHCRLGYLRLWTCGTPCDPTAPIGKVGRSTPSAITLPKSRANISTPTLSPSSCTRAATGGTKTGRQ
jgi:PAS domain S-box-containing protein